MKISQAIHQSFYAVLQPYNIKVYEEPETFFTEFEVREQLCLMNCQQGIDCLNFDNDKSSTRRSRR